MDFTQCILPLVQVPHGDNVVVVVVNDKELHFGIKLSNQQSDKEAKIKEKERKIMIIKSKKQQQPNSKGGCGRV